MSLFWTKLSKQHEVEIACFGFENFKRHQNFRYFNWNWQWQHVFAEQMKFLLGHSQLSVILDCLKDLPRYEKYNKSCSWLYAFAVRLLWEFAKTKDELGVLNLEEPVFGNPVPVYWKGRLISQDLANSALEIHTMRPALIGSQTVLELGAGYGRTAYAILSLFPKCEYIVVDIEPALSISKWYLSRMFHQRKMRFLSPKDLSGIQSKSVSLSLSLKSP